MGWLRKPAAPVGPVAVEELDPVEPSLAGTPYVGDKRPIFRDGFFYLCATDANGVELGPDTTVKLVWRDGGFHYAEDTDPNHFHTYGANNVDLEPGSE